MSASSGQPRSEASYDPALDGVRGIAILIILLYHLFLWPVLFDQITPTLAIDKAVDQVVDAGWIGVDLFFVLSGFLITGILLRAREGLRSFRSFYARRFLRIFPVYYGFLFLMIVALPSLPALQGNAGFDQLREHQVAYWTYLFNVAVSLNPFDYAGPYMNGHFWSLAVEEQFYLVWPLIVLLLGRRRLAVFCVVCIVAAPLIRLALIEDVFPELHGGLAAYTLMPARMDALAIGGLLAVIAGDPGLLRRAQPWAVRIGVAGALAAAIVGVTQGRFYWLDEQVQVIGYSAIALTFGAFLTLVAAASSGPLRAACSHPVLAFFGAYSYALYVFHFQLAQVTYSQIENHGGLPDVWGSYLPAQAAVGLGLAMTCVAAAWLSWHFFEKHFLKLKRFVPYGRAGARPPASEAAPQQP